jgi:NAD kinase
MEASCSLENFETRAEVQVIGVSQDDLGFYLFFEFSEMNGLDTAVSAHRHIYRCSDVSVIRVNETGPGLRRLIRVLQFKDHC